MKRHILAVALSIVGVAGSALAPLDAQAQVNLPTPNCGVGSIANNCLKFDDATVFSLGLLSYYQTQFGLNPGFDFTYKPNEATVTVIDGAGQGVAANQGPGKSIDDPFRAMTGGSSFDNMLFLMAGDSITTGNGTIPSDPGGGPTGDNSHTINQVVNSTTFTTQARFGPNPESQFAGGANDPCFASMETPGCMQSWDADVVAIKNALAGSNALVFMFNNNETGDSGTLAGQDLLAWARITLFDKNSNATKTFTLSGNNTLLPQQRDAQTAGVDDILPTADDLWAHVHSEICVNQVTGAVFLGECSGSGFGADGKTVNQSLGADEAGFAITVEALNDILFNPNNVEFGKYTNMAVDIRFSHLNNGADNVWIMGANFPVVCSPTDPNCNPPTVPEPASMALTGLALAALAGIRRRKTRQA